jgi:two-component system nitrate/nitrite sensor histidine kinase NarX
VRVQQAPQWRIEVRDDGRGFEPNASHTETQVGLKIMRERAQRIGATVQLASAPGRGTSVILTLPAAAPATPAPEDEHADSPVGG